MHTWGSALLSKVCQESSLENRKVGRTECLRQFPIINSTHHLLPSPRGELAPAIEAILDVYGTEVTVVISHNGQGTISATCH